MEFLLGVDAPVSLELLRQIVLGVVVNTAAALPMWLIVRRVQADLPDDRRRPSSCRTWGSSAASSRA